MTIEFKSDDSPGDKDSWAKLAENLFGINFTKSSEPPPELPTAAPERPSSTDEEPSEEAVEASSSEEDGNNGEDPAESSDPFGVFDEVEDIDDVEQADVSGEDVADEDVADEESDDEADTFWDALNSWDWGDEPRDSKPKPEQRSSRRAAPASKKTPTPSATERAAPVERVRFEETDVAGESAAAFRDEYVDDSDFGAGLATDDTVSSVKAEPATDSEAIATESFAAETTTASDGGDSETGEDRPKRRRRRRRRPSRKTEATTEGVDGAEGATEAAEEEPDETDEESPAVVVEESVSDSEESNAEPAPEKRRSSRRRSRRRRRPVAKSETEEQPTTTASAETSTDPDVSGDDDNSGIPHEHADGADADYADADYADDATDAERKSSTSKIPTWEEAMSYLLNKQPAETQSGTSPRSSSGRRRSRRGSKST